MKRTTFTIDDDTLGRLRRASAERDVSMATIIREAIEEKVERLAPRPRSLGIGASDSTDTARRTGNERPEPRAWR